jgi:hypothetical protein
MTSKKQLEMPRNDEVKPFFVQPSRQMVIFLADDSDSRNFVSTASKRSFKRLCILADAEQRAKTEKLAVLSYKC